MARKKKEAEQSAKTNGAAARPMSREEFFAFAFSRVNEKLSGAARQNLEANWGLQYDYPDEYAAFLDDWEGMGRSRRLIRRLVAHSPDAKVVSEAILRLPDEDQRRINFVWLDDPFSNEIWL